jgi:hypothetical protein
MWGIGMYRDNMQVIVISEINKVSAGTYFVSEGQSSRPPTVILGYVVAERNPSVFFGDERDSVHYDARI